MAPLADSSRPNPGFKGGMERSRRVLRSRIITTGSELGVKPPRPKSSGPFVSQVRRGNRPPEASRPTEPDKEETMNVERSSEEPTVNEPTTPEPAHVEQVVTSDAPPTTEQSRLEHESLEEAQHLLEQAQEILEELDRETDGNPEFEVPGTRKGLLDSLMEGVASGTTSTVEGISSGVNKVGEVTSGFLDSLFHRACHYHDSLMGKPIDPSKESTSGKILLTVGSWTFTIVSGTTALITNAAQTIVLYSCSGVAWIIAAVFATGVTVIDTLANILVKIKNALTGKQYTEQQKGDDIEFCVA